MGEQLAAWFLGEHGLEVIDRNLSLPGGEIDLLVRDGRRLAAVEVRTTTGRADPVDAVDSAKRAHVKRLAAGVGAGRVDFVGVGVRDRCFDVHWVQS